MAPDEPARPPDPSTWKLPRLRIDRDGTWFNEDGEITHLGILENLRSNLRQDAGGHYVQVGPARIPVEVDDAPFAVLRVEQDDRALVLTVNDLTRERLVIDTLRIDEQGIPRCLVKDGRFTARFTRAATYQLLQFAEHDDAGRPAALVVAGARFRIGAGSDPTTA